MKWLYYDYMGKYNPVCVDAGNITDIVFVDPDIPNDGTAVQELIADGNMYHCDCKEVFFEKFGFVLFEPLGVEKRKFPNNVKHGDEIKMPFNDSSFVPITTDPRVLYIMYRAFHNDVEGLKIPTREYALQFLREVGAKTDCIPVQF